MLRLPAPGSLAESPVPADMVLTLEQLDTTPITSAMVRKWTRKDPVLAQVVLARDREIRGTVAILPLTYGAESPGWLCVVGSTCFDTRSWVSWYSAGTACDPP